MQGNVYKYIQLYVYLIIFMSRSTDRLIYSCRAVQKLGSTRHFCRLRGALQHSEDQVIRLQQGGDLQDPMLYTMGLVSLTRHHPSDSSFQISLATGVKVYNNLSITYHSYFKVNLIQCSASRLRCLIPITP